MCESSSSSSSVPLFSILTVVRLRELLVVPLTESMKPVTVAENVVFKL